MEPMLVYDLKALSQKLHIGVRTLREYIKRKELKASKIGRSFYVMEQDLQEFIFNTEAYPQRRKGEYP